MRWRTAWREKDEVMTVSDGDRYPRVSIDTEKLRDNAACVLQRCRSSDVQLTAVTKGTCAHPDVVRALLAAGVKSLGDSRIRNLRRLRKMAPDVQLVLLRLPGPSLAAETVRFADVSLNSEASTLRALNEAARCWGVSHGVWLMVDVGDLREGVWIDDVADLAEAAAGQSELDVMGVGTNLACYGGVIPSAENMERLLKAREVAAEVLGHLPPVVSGGNSANWNLLVSGEMPQTINNLRIGEALLLGQEAVRRQPICGAHRDVFSVEAEIIEVKTKPSVPVGEVGQDAFGHTPTFEDRGWHRRAIVALGRQDVDPAGLQPVMEGVQIIGASSDHMILDVGEALGTVEVGEVLAFVVTGYSALLALFTSVYVNK